MHYQINNFELLKELLQTIPDDDACMEWPRGVNRYGYGQLQTWDRTQERLVHRAAFKLVNGSIPDGMMVLHKCDNPPCFRPSHLFPGDQVTNMRDCAAKKRTKRNCKLQPAQVETIRLLAARGARQAQLAAAFGVDQSTISMIVNFRLWK